MKKEILIALLIIVAIIFSGCAQENTQVQKKPVELTYSENDSYCGDEKLLSLLPSDDDLIKTTDKNKGTSMNCAELSKYFTQKVPYLTSFVYKPYAYDNKAIYTIYVMVDEDAELAGWHVLKIYSDMNTLGRSAEVLFIDGNKVLSSNNKDGFDWAAWKSENKVIVIEGHGVGELYPRIVKSMLEKFPSDTQ